MGQFLLKNTFVRGEISPLAAARNDIALYQQSAEELLNFHVLKEGGVRRRSGTRYRGPTKTTGDVRLVPFIFNNSQAYALEFGELYMRPWALGGNVLSGGLPYEVVSPYTAAQLPSITWAQVNDVLYIAFASKTIKPKKLKRLAHANWVFEDVEFQDGPYLPINDQANGMRTDVVLDTGVTAECTFDSTTGINGGSGLLATDVGRHIRMQFGGKWSWGIITAVTSTTVCDVEIKEGNGFGGGGTVGPDSYGGAQSLISRPGGTETEVGAGNVNELKTFSWRLGAFSDTTGYPGSVTLFQGRVVWARTDNNPRAIFYSRSNMLDVFSPSDVDGVVVDSHGGMLDITGSRGDEILWLQEAPRLQIGTGSAIRSIGASDTEQTFSPRNVSQRLEIAQGVAAVKPEVVGPSTVHAGRLGRTISDLFFDFQANSLVAPNLSVVSDHLFKAGVKEIAFQQVPNSMFWCLLHDGTLTSTTIERYEKVVGFSRHRLGGNGIVKSICSIPGTLQDELYMAVRRTVNGATVQYVEMLDPQFDGHFHAKPDAFFVDCGATYSGSPTTTVSGLGWLANATVDILADGHVLPSAQVSALGVLVLPNGREASKISIGYEIEARGKVLRAPTAVPDGAGLGRRCRVAEVMADLYETLGLEFRSDRGQTDTLRQRSGVSPYESDTALMSGTHPILIDGSWSSEGQFEFVSTKPLPATIRALNIHLETEP